MSPWKTGRNFSRTRNFPDESFAPPWANLPACRRWESRSYSRALRFHDLRRHAITELAESQASDATIMAIAGHVSRQMLDHYFHVRMI
jgi:integrase